MFGISGSVFPARGNNHKKRQQAQNCESLVLAHYRKFLFKGEGTINFVLIKEE